MTAAPRSAGTGATGAAGAAGAPRPAEAAATDLQWSLRAMRGEMAEVVRTLLPESDLLFVGTAARLRCPVLLVG